VPARTPETVCYAKVHNASSAEEIASKIIANGPVAARLCLEAVNKGMEMPLEQGTRPRSLPLWLGLRH
jgi:hypothetical protein